MGLGDWESARSRVAYTVLPEVVEARGRAVRIERMCVDEGQKEKVGARGGWGARRGENIRLTRGDPTAGTRHVEKKFPSASRGIPYSEEVQ